jgi:fatty acid desaturase
VGPSGQQQRATGLATASAVLGTLALLAVLLTFGVLFFVALPVGATVGVVTGVLAVLLSLLVVALIAVVTIALDGIDLGGLPDAIRDLIPQDLERELDRQLPEVPDGVITE